MDRPVPPDLTPIPFEGRAVVRGNTLRIEGKARYPNDFSTASLEPLAGVPLPSPAWLAFALEFHRDKEPFCDLDLIGPVVHYSRVKWLARIEMVRVYVTPDMHEDIRVEQQPG